MSRYCTLKAFAADHHIHYETARRKAANGTLPTVRIGRAVRVDLDAFAAMEAADQAPAAERPVADTPDPHEAYVAFIEKLVADAPPLSGEQRDRLAAILGGGR